MSIFSRYQSRLPQVAEEFRCTLGEGNTPLLRSRVIGPELGLQNLFFKCEHQNPTGSYKDRFLALELSLLRQSGATIVFGTSSGNTGSSLSAFAARYGLPCHLFVCELTPTGKLLQMKAHGSQVHRVRGFCVSQEVSKSVMKQMAAVAKERGTRPIISAFAYAPDGMKGVQTIAYEVEEQLDVVGLRAQHFFAPAGGCGLFLGIARGFIEGGAPPRMHVVQPRLNDTVVTALRENRSEARASATTTSISGLAVPQVIDGDAAITAARKTGGTGVLIEDEDALFWQQKLLREEGVWVEPAGAVALAGLATAAREGTIAPEETAVCVLTGHGFKDPSSALPDQTEGPMRESEEVTAILNS